MHLLFIDESGTPPPPDRLDKGPRYFVIGGIIIPEASWHRVRDRLFGIKTRHRIRGELKWRYFAPNNTDTRNPMRALSQTERDAVREDVYKLLTVEKSLRTIACVASAAAAYKLASIPTQGDLYHATYKPVTERFQYYLQDLKRASGRTEFGIVVADHRGAGDDARLRGHHQKLLYATGDYISTYANLIESLFLHPSHLSVGIQLADMVAGAVWRKFERNDDRWYGMLEPTFRRNAAGKVEGFGVVKFPKTNWE